MTATDQNLPKGVQEKLNDRARRLQENKVEARRLTAELAEARAEAQHAMLVVDRVVRQHTAFKKLPPEELRLHVGTRTTRANFLANGLLAAARVLQVFGEEPEGPTLDWGCGSGRTANWLLPRSGWKQHYYGVDVDPEAITWFGAQGVKRLSVCNDDPPLPYEDNTFTGLFAFSVLTHIPPQHHERWYAEINRVLKPGGRAFLTTQGDATVHQARADVAEAYARDGWAYQDMDGHYKAAALSSPAFTQKLIGEVFEVESFQTPGYHNMDAFVVRKR